MKWKYLTEGNYNTIYISEDQKNVLKIQLDQIETTEAPHRAVRLWNQINTDMKPQAYVYESEYGLGWVCPYIKGSQSSDGQMKKALIKIYNQTGRIIVDAISPKNFITQQDGTVVCVDVSLALQLENRIGRNLRQSVESLNFWNEMSKKFDEYFTCFEEEYPQTVRTIRALLFIKLYRPDINEVSFLQANKALAIELAQAYDSKNVDNALTQLLKYCPKSEQKKPVLVHSTEMKPAVSQLEKKIQKKSHVAKNPCSFLHPNSYKNKLRDRRGSKPTYYESSRMNSK